MTYSNHFSLISFDDLRRVKISCDTVSIETKLIGLKTYNNFNSVNFLFIIFKIALQNANVEIVNVEIICIKMQWQRKQLLLTV